MRSSNKNKGPTVTTAWRRKGGFAALMASTLILPHAANAADAEDYELEEIVVTATKRASNLQDVPVAVQALTSKTLEDLNIKGFDDYINFLPTVSYVSFAPGLAQVYMRGISSGGDGVHSGSQPSVAVYLDEQPITTINNVLDVHVYDVARIETLAGPQGTLFGSSSQAGTMRIITNQPDPSGFAGGYDISLNKVEHGEAGYSAEAFVNAPLSDTAALRVVGWYEDEGGYIDNVYGERQYAASGIEVDNADYVEDDFNDVRTAGMRALLKVDLNDSWTVTPGVTYQNQKSRGSWAHRPDDLGDLKFRTFGDEFANDEWIQGTLTINGKIGDIDVVYAGAYLDRDNESSTDYSWYAEYWEGLLADYGYDCLYYDELGGCADPTQHITGDEKFKRQSHELRLSSPGDSRLRWIAGAFYQDQEHDFDLRWVAPDVPTGEDYSPVPGEPLVWITKQVRKDKDRAVFGEVSYDLTDQLSATAGLRLYKLKNSLVGYYGSASSTYCAAQPCLDHPNLDKATKDDGATYKFNLSYKIDDDKMVYATYSKGFRPGGVNRALTGVVAPAYEQDFVYNYELGWKTSFLNRRLRFNGAVYMLDWKNFQYSFLDFSISPLTLITNVGQARTKGFEFDTVFAATERLTLSLSGSYNDAKLQEDYYQDDDDLQNGVVSAPDGTRMPFVPKLKLTATARYSFEIGSLPAYFQGSWSHTGESWNNLKVADRVLQPSYDLVNMAIGVEGDGWTAEIFADNVTDERAVIYADQNNFVDFPVYTNRPRRFGIRFGQRF
ncbi:TonB-dependent receptor [Kordiimonas gwangyangensis]|uniref:TonB-dependent receptor n=1 Tax=Kordiimonas gwangyangensis TaxID=288022 RepID=UPI000372F3F3|nr:TonB-dependent receptor [Kordiimonas gwangyangensis]